MNYKTVSTSIGGIIILILSVISFVFMPTMIQRGGKAATLGSWDGIAIQNTEDSEFTSQYRNLAGYAESQNLVPSNEFARNSFYHSLAKVAFDSSVVELAMQSEIEKAGYIPSDLLVSKVLVNYYLDDSGMYSQAKYQKTPANTRSAYKKSVEHSVMVNRFVEDLFGTEKKGGMKMSLAESAFIKDMAKKVREYKYITFNLDDYPKEEIKKYGLEKANMFDKYDFSALVYETRDEAETVAKALKDGSKTFEEALDEIKVKRLTDDAGKLARNERQDIAQLFPDNADLDKIASLKKGEFSDVMESSSVQYMIFRCDGDVEKADFEKEETINRVFEKMKTEDRGRIEEYLIAKAKKWREDAKNEGFEATAARDGREVKESSGFALNYGSLSYFPSINAGKDVSLAPASKNEDFYRDVFSIKNEEISQPHLLGGNVVLLSLAKERDAEKMEADNEKVYKNQCGNYLRYYGLIMLLSAQGMNYYNLPLCQKTFMDFIEKNPKRVDTHEVLFSNDRS